MTKLHADYYADAMTQLQAVAVTNDEIADHTFRMRVEAPAIAAHAVPGQFVMIRMAGVNAPLIGRALAIYDIADNEQGEPTYLDVIYLRKGALTTPLSSASAGTPIELWGPLGNGFAARPCQTLIMAVGGIGQTPMLLLGREAIGKQSFGGEDRASRWAENAEIIYGARSAGLLAGVDDFRDAGFAVTLCTDDGSLGQQARVPDVLKQRLSELDDLNSVRVVTCGPEIMMEKVAQLCQSMNVDCQVSMETPMACGIGICFSCVAKVNQEDGGWDYKRTCVEGPIFDACQICWD